jgi:hypothetical protein
VAPFATSKDMNVTVKTRFRSTGETASKPSKIRGYRGDNTVMRHFRIQDWPAARDQKVMRQLRIRDLPPAADKLGAGTSSL